MNKLKIKLLNFLLKNVYNAITEKDVITLTSKGYKIGDELMDVNQVENLKNQANAIRHSDLWMYINNNLKYLANYRMYHGSKTIDDMVFSKAMLYDLEIINKLFKKISER